MTGGGSAKVSGRGGTTQKGSAALIFRFLTGESGTFIELDWFSIDEMSK